MFLLSSMEQFAEKGGFSAMVKRMESFDPKNENDVPIAKAFFELCGTCLSLFFQFYCF